MADITLARTALYRLYDADEQLLYIGITYDPLKRLEQHSRREWWPLVEIAKVQWFDNRARAATAERDAIKAEDPKHNIVYSNNPAWPQYTAPIDLTNLTAEELKQHFAEMDRQQQKARRLLEEAGEIRRQKTPQELLAGLSEGQLGELLARLKAKAA
jgi:predicted GIY-YIG superfamily endonuclease